MQAVKLRHFIMVTDEAETPEEVKGAVFLMSYRELRNFTEMMHELGYPRLISMENFRTPNFPLVAEILVWLVKRFDPDVCIPMEIRNEEGRVALILAVAQMFVLKANLKLNTKKLYQADGYAVKEMLKVTNLLHESLKTTYVKNKIDDDLPEISFVATAIKIQELKNVTQLVGEIVSSGASLFELLGKEGESRELRNNRASRHLEINQVEQAVKESIAHVSKEIEHTKQMVEGIVANELTLESKIEKKKADLERHNKRLQTLKKIRPAFMEEFEKFEEELKGLYSNYVIKCRNIAYLENVLEQTEQSEQKKLGEKQAFTRKLIEDLKQEEAEDNFSEGLEESLKPITKPFEASRKHPFARDVNEKEERQRKISGSLGDGHADSESFDDSDSDLLLDGDVTENDDLEIGNQPARDMSDDDF